MPTLNPPLLQGLAAGLPPDIGQKLGAALRAQDKHNVDVAASLSSALVRGDTLQVLTPYTAASPLTVPTDWQTPTLNSGWSNFGSPWEVAAYRKNSSGLVTVKGLVKSTNALPSTVFTLPTGFRPAENVRTASSGSTGGGDAFYSLSFQTDGSVVCQSGAAAPSASLSVDSSFYCSDFSPYVPSCFPFDVLWAKPYPPTLVLAQCAATDGSNVAMALADWTTVVKGGSTFLHVRNLPGLLPSKSYSVTLLAL